MTAFKKAFGQHFLTSKAALRAIVAAGEVSRGDLVLEIGPGRGVLTKELLLCGARVVAVEKDKTLVEALTKMFANDIARGNLSLVSGDILDFDPACMPRGPYKLIANIPYYLTGAIIRRFLSAPRQPERMVLLVQREVALRIARSKKESVLSLSVKAYGTPRYVKTVPAGAFSPPPKVDSAILLVSDISRERFKAVSEERFFKIIKAGFARKRKKLASNLALIARKEDVLTALSSVGIPENARAEDVAPPEWHVLSSQLS